MSEVDNRPMWDGRRGRYEVWFLTLSSPDGDRGYWIRYTLRAPVAGPVEPRLWFARFDRSDPARTFGINRGVPPQGLRTIADPFEVAVDGSTLRSGRAAGEVSGDGHQVRWDLGFETGGATFRMLPARLYRGGLAPTKPFTPNPDLRFEGTLEVDGETIPVDGFPGQQGHLYGTRHGERWAWAFCNAFEDGRAFQLLCAQGRRGPIRTPYLTFAAVRTNGGWVRLRGVSRRRPWGLGWWRVDVSGGGYRLEGTVRAEPEHMVRARYLDPDDTPRWCHNSEVASSHLVLWERTSGGWRTAAELASEGTTHAEWAGRTPAEAVDTEHREVP